MSSSFDFVIVGGGTSGLVLAARLSEIHHLRVLVLEAGEDCSNDFRVKTPAMWASLLGSELDWCFNTESQAGLNGRSVTVNQGKALGGSSAINAQVFVPPTKANVSAWETLGNEGWGWDMIQKSVTKTYTCPPVDEKLEAALRIDEWAAKNQSARGPIQTSYPKVTVHEAWAKTMEALGYSMANDPFLGAASGSFSNQLSIDPETKERSYSATAYYQPCKDRESLVVLTGAYAEKIIFDQVQEGGVKAVGVRYTHDGTTKTVLATKEVVLAAGTFQSPKLLELSGIGDSQLLAKLGVKTVQDLPGVGENLQDHLACGIGYKAVDSLETLDGLVRQEPEAIGQAMQEYAANKSGALASTGIDTYAYLPILDHVSQDSPSFERLRKLLDDNMPPESDGRASALYSFVRQTLLDPKAPSAAYFTMRAQGPHPIDPVWSPDSPAGPVPGKFLTIATVLSQPLSPGTSHIRSADPADAPAIDPAYLSHPVDAEVMAAQLLQVEQIAASEPLSRALLAQPLQRRDPASDFGGDLERAKRFARTSGTSMWHPVGTCAMLPVERRGVVDTELRVHRVQGLRVVDASVMPLVCNANLQAVVYGVAERAAELIKASWGV